jgi:hypothetical protein
MNKGDQRTAALAIPPQIFLIVQTSFKKIAEK